MQEFIYHSHFKLEETFWWFLARNKVVYNILDKKCKLADGDQVLDVGCGTGGFAMLLAKRFEVICLDTSALALDYCRQRGLRNLYNCYLDEFPAGEWNIKAITMLDVIEHIEDDVKAVSDAYKILPKGGYLIATVPAYMWLWTQHDVYHMHYRRYTRKSFKNLLKSAGFNINYTSYLNTLLFGPAFLKRMMEKISSNYENIEDIYRISPFLNTTFKNIFSLESKMLPALSFPFGVSVIVIAQK